MRDKTDNSVWLKDIFDSIDLIQRYTANLTQEELFHSEEKQDAVVRRLGIIGEAVKNLPNEFKAEHPDIPWSKAAGMRNVVVHEYFNIDVNITWNVLQRDLPKLKKAIERLINK